MKIRNLIFSLVLLVGFAHAQSLPKVSSGSIQRLESFPSKFVEARNVDVWFPDGYDQSKKYGVVYMHDGQNLFDSLQTWNRKEWGVDETFSRLMKEGKIDRCILVAIWNTGGNRISEYFPDKIFSELDQTTKDKFTEKYTGGKPANGDNYLRFMVEELKPYIDQHFSTYTDKGHTFIMGSSLGATISFYAINEYPEVFGGAACLSTAWLSSIEPNYEIPVATFAYLKKHMASPLGHKIYFDYGTGESDKNYELTQSFVDLIVKGKGFDNSNYQSKVFEKDEHEERAWSRRLHFPVEFLIGK
jgi:predicted alpha/beta superfamily hydrolase